MASSSASRDRADYPGAGPWVPKRLSLSAIRTSAQACEGCDLFSDATQAVVGDGPLDAGATRGTAMGWEETKLELAHPPETVVATTHPSAALRSRQRDRDYGAFVADLRVAAAAVGD